MEMLVLVCESVKNFLGTGENAVYQCFLSLPQDFQKVVLSGSRKLELEWLRVNMLTLSQMTN